MNGRSEFGKLHSHTSFGVSMLLRRAGPPWRTSILGMFPRIKGSTSASDLTVSRFRQIPTFGRGTVRRFCSNVSEMKKLAGHNYDNLLAVSLFTLHDSVFP